MIAIKNYDSRNSISTYELGDVCACYINNTASPRLVKANSKDVEKYGKKLDKVIKENPDLVHNNGKYGKFVRAIGVVIEKIPTKEKNGVDMITVMFKTTNNKYVLNKYAVGTKSVLMNGKDYVQPTTVIYVLVYFYKKGVE